MICAMPKYISIYCSLLFLHLCSLSFLERFLDYCFVYENFNSESVEIINMETVLAGKGDNPLPQA